MDNHSRIVKRWTELTNPRDYFEFFKAHEHEFAEQEKSEKEGVADEYS